MRSSSGFLPGLGFIFLGLLQGCAPGDSDVALNNLPNGRTLAPLSGDNVMTLTVNGSNCSNRSYINKPCVSLTVCAPGTSVCQTLNDILVDTGSVGLRIFRSVLIPNLSSLLTPVVKDGKSLAECTQYGQGTANWGPVTIASVGLAAEPPVEVPIQLVDMGFAKIPRSCQNPDPDPDTAGFNGILGVGLFAPDCGAGCATHQNNGVYFLCDKADATAKCESTAVGLADQVQNPVARLPQDNNGVIVMLPSVPSGGVSFANGYLVLGIGTRPNNTPAGVAAYPTDPQGDFVTRLNGKMYPAFLDTGSNTISFDQAAAGTALPDCGRSDPRLSGFFCPPATVTLSAVVSGISGTPSTTVTFQVGNTIALSGSNNNVFADIGTNGSVTGDNAFDWGLPFYLGRNVYVGIEGTSSSLGQGPYWGF